MRLESWKLVDSYSGWFWQTRLWANLYLRQWGKTAVYLLLFLCLFLYIPSALHAQEGEVNLLANGRLESRDHWTPFGAQETAPDLGAYVREGKAIVAPSVEGQAQGWSAGGIAGLYQQVSVIPNSTLRLSVWTTAVSPEEAWVKQRVGIDPTGGTNPLSEQVIWSLPAQFVDEWGEVSVQAQAQGETVTVYLSANPSSARPSTIWFDEAVLRTVAYDLPQKTAVSTNPPDPLLVGIFGESGIGPGQQGIPFTPLQPTSNPKPDNRTQLGWMVLGMGLLFAGCLFLLARRVSYDLRRRTDRIASRIRDTK